MNDLAIMWDEADRMQVGNELSRLFALQDVPLGKEKKAILIEELAIQGLPPQAVVEGMRSLAKEELGSIKFNTILSAAHQKLEPDAIAAMKCDRCHDVVVLMRDEKGYWFSLGCVCARGEQRATSLKIARWNGEATQYRRGRTLFFLPKPETGSRTEGEPDVPRQQ